MLKRKIKSRLIRKKLIFISIIISLSIMGVGYAAWNDGTIMNMSIKTAYTWPCFFLEDSRETFSNGEELLFSLSDDGNTLNINGKVYPSFNEDISIKIIDKGTIPSVFSNVSKEDNDISELNKHSDKQRNNLNKNNNYLETFELNINPNTNNDKTMRFGETFSNFDERTNLERTIKILEEEIELYSRVEKYSFKYVMNFEQGIGSGKWGNELYINGNIKVVPDTEVLADMKAELQEVHNKLEQQKAYEESQRILAEQQKLEEQKPEGTGGEPEGTGSEPVGTGSEPEGTGGELEGAGREPEGTGSEPEGTGSEPEGTGSEPEGTGREPEGAGSEPEGAGSEPEGTGSEPEGTGSEPEGTGSEPEGTDGEPGGTDGEPGGTDGEPGGTNSEPEGASSEPEGTGQ